MKEKKFEKLYQAGMIPQSEWKWHGLPGHFISADKCVFRLHTTVGEYKISTVGALYRNGVLEEIGLDRHYETYVFHIPSYSEVDSEGLYLGPKTKHSTEIWDMKAEEMHLAMCFKWAKKQ